jgi:hypothetical protein
MIILIITNGLTILCFITMVNLNIFKTIKHVLLIITMVNLI